LATSIEIRELKEIRLRGGVLIDCTNTADFERSKLADRLISHLNLEIVAYVESDSFPSIATIIEAVPHPPMRIYSNHASKIGVIKSDFVPSDDVEKPLGRSLLSWARNKAVGMILTSVLASPVDPIESDLGAISTTSNARRRVEHSKIDPVGRLTVEGLPAALLNEASWTNFDVIALVVRALHSSEERESEVSPLQNIEEIIIQGIDVIIPEIKMNFEDTITKNQLEYFADKKSMSTRSES